MKNNQTTAIQIPKAVQDIDFYSMFVAEDGSSIRKELTIDGVHPNVFGYDLMYSKLMDFITKQNLFA